MRSDTLFAVLALANVGRAVHLSDARLSQVYDQMSKFSKYSWENGTKAQAILEWTYPDLSVFSTSSGSNPFPTSISTNQIPQIMDIAQVTMRNRPATNTSGVNGGSSLLEDGAAADPASLGPAVLLAGAATGNAQVNGVGYGDAARMEANYLLYNVPRSSTGAISHRTSQSQYWADFVSMVPPFLAMYAEYTRNQTIMQAAYDQCRLYRDFLRRPLSGGQGGALWAHIQGGQGNLDPGLWATGNAWAAYGMLRVWATIGKSSYNGQMGSQRGDLANWVGEIMQGCSGYVTSNGLLRNYINDTSSFEETSASALIAATGLRMSLLGITDAHVPMSLTLLSKAGQYVSNSTGVLTQVVDPLDWSTQGQDSPEGQSFMIMAYAAHREWDRAGRKGAPSNADGGDGLGGYTSAAGRRWSGLDGMAGAGALAAMTLAMAIAVVS